MKIAQRTIQMKERFMDLHNEGKTISEIAEICNVSSWTVYNNLGEIAKKNGVNREDLLQRVVKPWQKENVHVEEEEKVETSEILAKYDEALDALSSIKGNIDNILVKEQEEK